MVREISLEKVALNLESTLSDVKNHRTHLIIVHEGKRVMAMVPIEFYERWFADREKAFKYFDDLHTRSLPYPDEEVDADIEQAIREIRAKDSAK